MHGVVLPKMFAPDSESAWLLCILPPYLLSLFTHIPQRSGPLATLREVHEVAKMENAPAMSTQPSVVSETIECPLCLGKGHLKRTEILDRLGVKDFARVAQLSAEEAIRLLLSRHKQDEQNMWARFEAELTKRTAYLGERHKDQLHSLTARNKELESAATVAVQQRAHDMQDANRRVEDSLREVATLRERNQELEGEMAKVARVGKREELDFADEVRTWSGVHIGDKLPKNGDYLLAFRDPSGAALEPRLLVDNKDKAAVAEADIRKLVRDAKERHAPVGVIVTRDETQLRQTDRECRWAQEDGVWILRTTRQWLRRDLDVLRPLLDRMRAEGPDFLQKNAAIAEEVRRTLVDLDEVEKELKKASKAIDAAWGLTGKYRVRLQVLCDTTHKKPTQRQQDASGIARAGD
jgi:hypothetical protein